MESGTRSESQQGPRRLPVVCLGGVDYFVDRRLSEFREANNPHRRVDFGSMRGKAMLNALAIAGYFIFEPERPITPREP